MRLHRIGLPAWNFLVGACNCWPAHERHLGDAAHLDMGCGRGCSPEGGVRNWGRRIASWEVAGGGSIVPSDSCLPPWVASADRGRNEPHGDGSSEECQASAARTVARELHRCAEPSSR